MLVTKLIYLYQLPSETYFHEFEANVNLIGRFGASWKLSKTGVKQMNRDLFKPIVYTLPLLVQWELQTHKKPNEVRTTERITDYTIIDELLLLAHNKCST